MKRPYTHNLGLLVGNIMKFLVTGSAGLIGRQVVKDTSTQNYQIHASYHETKPEFGMPIRLDLTNLNEISKVMNKTKPDSVIHLAALTNVDLCETQKDLAMKINAKSTEILAKEAAKHDSFFLYVSTDYVFDGNQGMKKETDKTNPLGFYGKSKLEGEKALYNLASSWCIARTSTPFGTHPTKKSFPLWIIENLKQKKEIKVITDQFTSPTYIPNLSKMLIEIATKQLVGIYHVAGASKISRYNLAELIAEKMEIDKKLLKPITMDEMKWQAQRPKDSSLDVSKASTILNEKPKKIEESIDLFLTDLEKL